MKSHTDAAVGARDHVAADMALQKIVKSAPVQKHHALAARLEILAQSRYQSGRQWHRLGSMRPADSGNLLSRAIDWLHFCRDAIRLPGLSRLRDLAPHIDDFNGRHRAIVDPAQKAQQPVPSAPRIRERLP